MASGQTYDLKISPELTLANSVEPSEQQKRALCATIYLEVGLEVGFRKDYAFSFGSPESHEK